MRRTRPLAITVIAAVVTVSLAVARNDSPAADERLRAPSAAHAAASGGRLRGPLAPPAAASAPGLGRPPRPSAPAAASAMFRGDAAHTGVYDVRPVEHLGGVRWRFPTNGPVRSSPTVFGDAVYVGSGDGFVYAIHALTGRSLWRFDAGASVSSSPAVSDELVYAQNRNGEFFALDRRRGTLRWRRATGPDVPWDWGGESGDIITSSPVLAGDVVVFGSGDAHVYALDARTGDLRWRFRTGGRVRSTPSVHEGIVVVGSMDGSVYVLDLESGELVRRLDTEGRSLFSGDFGYDRRSVQSSPAVVDGRAFVGGKDGFLYAFDLDDGRRLWRFDNRISWVLSAPAVADGVVYAGTSDGHYVNAVDAGTGEELWRHETPASVWSSPAVAGDFVYIAGNSGRLYALDRRTGEERWRFFTGGRMISSPTPADGALFVGSDDGGVYALRSADAPVRRAVFWDSTLVRATWYPNHETLRDGLAGRGYAVVDAAGLARIMTEQLRDGGESVVVFAMDRVPASVAAVPADTTLFRRYLDAGGKIVWPGLPPFVWRRDPMEGAPADGLLAIDREATRRLLGVDHERAIFDTYGATPTDEGRRWGIDRWWTARWAAGPDPSIVPLAIDENGLAPAWIRSYGGPPGTGFVRVPETAEPLQVYLAAEMRPASAPAPASDP